MQQLSSSNANSRLPLITVIVVLLCTAKGAFLRAQEPVLQSKRFYVNCLSGSLVALQVPDQTIRWTDLSTPGRMTERPVRLSEIRQAILCREAAGSKVAQVKKWIDDLKGEDYYARETAERELTNPEVGGRFKSMLEAEKNHPLMETRYRIQRILSELEKRDDEAGGTFDRIQLTDGSWLRGDLGELVIQSDYRGQTLRLTRAQILSLTEIGEQNGFDLRTIPDSQPVRIETFQRFDDSWKAAQYRFVDFQWTPDGQPLPTRTDVNDAFIPFGLQMSSERPGYIGISGYAFRTDCPPKENSICVFESVGNAFQRFKGAMDFTFCLPNQPGIAAGVHEFSLFLYRVDRPRDFILEAYNSDGCLIGVAEASDANCTFHGIRSSEPMARIRLLSNPYLFSLNRKVDEDYCVDDLRFSTPVPLPFIRSNEQPGVMTTGGDRLMGRFRLSTEGVRVELTDTHTEITVPLSEVRSLVFENSPSPAAKGSRLWHVMLQDRTILEVDPTTGFETPWFEKTKLDLPSIACLWLAPNGIRFPSAGDIEQGSTSDDSKVPETALLVFPTCRIHTREFKIGKQGYSWGQFLKKEQDLWVKQQTADPNENTDPNITEIDYAETSPEKIPTLWLCPPPAWQPKLGLVRLTDGQQFTLGGNTNIELVQVNAESITLRWQGRTQDLPLKRVASIDLPIQTK